MAVSDLVSSYTRWFARLSAARKLVPVIFVALFWSSLLLLHGFRGDHLNIGILILVLSYGGPWLDRVLWFLLPLLATGIIYDSQRFYSDYLRGPVHVREPYDFDKRFFGIPTAQGVLTPNEWFQLHTHPVLDVITGFAYLVFIAAFVLFAAYFYFYLSRKGTAKVSASELKARAPGIMWSFFFLNMLGYSTYYWYAAAPPWYVALYGLGPADMSARPNQAGCVRFDQVLGTHFFSEMYGRSADVFGAVPSLHVAYPLLAVLYAFKLGAARPFAIGFYLLMCFSAVYLNHHYILDILWGSTYAILIGLLTDRYLARRASHQIAPA